MSRKMSRIVSGIMLSVLSRRIFRVMSRKMPRIVSAYQKMQNSIKNDSRKTKFEKASAIKRCKSLLKMNQESQNGKISVHLKMQNSIRNDSRESKFEKFSANKKSKGQIRMIQESQNLKKMESKNAELN